MSSFDMNAMRHYLGLASLVLAGCSNQSQAQSGAAAGGQGQVGGSGDNGQAARAGAAGTGNTCAGALCAGSGGTGGCVGPTCGGGGSAGLCAGQTCAGAGNVDPCASESCSGHGTCAVVGGSAVCSCEPGYDVRRLACVSKASLFGLTIPVDHPRLLFNAKNLAAAKTWYGGHPIANAKTPTLQAMKGLLVSDAASCDAAVTAAKANSAGMQTSGTACDDCRWSGEEDLLVYDWCYNQMDLASQKELETSIDAWVDHWRTQPWGGPPMHENNYYWGYLRNEFEWGVLSQDRDLSFATSQLTDVFSTRLDGDFYPALGALGGVGQEGAQYGPYVMGYAAVPLISAEQMGRAVLDENPYYLAAVYAYIYETTPNGSIFSWNDDDGYAPGTPSPFIANYMVAAAMHWSGAAVGGHARNWLKTNSSVEPDAHFLAIDSGVGAPLAFSGLPLDYFAAGPRYLFGRSSWTAASPTAYMLLLGDEDGVGHNHVDYGTFQIWRGGRWLSRESVGYGYSDLNLVALGGSGSSDVRLAVAHNTVAVGNTLPTEKDSPKLTRLESQSGYSFASVDLSPTFASAKVVRDIVFVRSLETFVILDRGSDVFLAHCETAPTTAGGTATCTNGSQSLVVSSLVGNPALSVVTEGSKSGQYRIEMRTAPGQMLTVLQAKDASAAALVPMVQDDATTYTVTLNGSVALKLVKGAESTGGSITIDGVTSNLRADVQPMKISSAGPSWQ
jgi:hypothetical protein